MISSDALADPAIDPCTGTSNPAGSSASCVPTGDMTEMCYWDGGSSKIVCDVAAYCDDTTYGSVSQIVANTSTAGVTTDYVYWGGCENGAKTWCCIIDDPSDEIGRIEISATDQHDFLAGVYTGGYTFHPLNTPFVLQLEGRDGDDDLLASTHADARTSALGGAGADFISALGLTSGGGSGAMYAEGGGDEDYLLGAIDADELYGQGGDDDIIGWSQDDTIDGGGGDDTICGDQATSPAAYGDSVASWSATCNSSGSGEDTIHGGTGADTIHAGPGPDHVFGGSGEDTLYGEGGEDELAGEADPDAVDGGDAHDDICGQGDLVRGGDGNDNIYMWPVSGGSYVGDYDGEANDNTNPGDACEPFTGFGNNGCETQLSPAACPF